MRLDITVVGRVTTLEGALAYWRDGRCEMVLVSANPPDNGALALTQAANQINPFVLLMPLPTSPTPSVKSKVTVQIKLSGLPGWRLLETQPPISTIYLQMRPNPREGKQGFCLPYPGLTSALIDPSDQVVLHPLPAAN